MIQAFIGLVGGGKSYCSTRRMMSYMALGGRVCSNIRLVGWDEKSNDLSVDSPVRSYLRSIGWEYQAKQYVYISFDEMVANPLWYQKIPAGISRDKRTLCVVDEATDLFDSLDGGRLKLDSGYRGLFHFLRLSRHAHIDVLFICQDLKSINTRLRGLVASIWRSTDMRHFRVGLFRCGFPFDVFMLQLFDKSGRNEMSREFVKKDQRIFSCYESETFGGSLGVKWDGVAVADGTIKKEGRKKMSMFWKILVLFGFLADVVLLCVYLFREPELPPAVVPSALPDTGALFTNLVNRVLYVESCYSNLFGVVSNAINSVDRAKPNVSPSVKPSRRVLRGTYVFHQAGDKHKWIEFDGDEFRVGAPCEYGRVLICTEYYTICVDDDGSQTMLCPTKNSFDERDKRNRSPPPALHFKRGGGCRLLAGQGLSKPLWGWAKPRIELFFFRCVSNAFLLTLFATAKWDIRL